jgi:hypothetical protein
MMLETPAASDGISVRQSERFAEVRQAYNIEIVSPGLALGSYRMATRNPIANHSALFGLLSPADFVMKKSL